MPSLYWPVIIVLSISVASVVSELQVDTSGLTARTIVPSPTPDCWSPSCLTWSQCLADPAQCFTSHTTVTMLHGEYILHEYVGVHGVVSLSIYGSRSEVNGSVRENQVIINCEYREGGIGFSPRMDFSLSGITMLHCGVQGVNGDFGDWEHQLRVSYFALYVFEGINVNISFLFIANSTQIGLLCINVRGTIQDSVITRSNYRLLGRYMQGEVKCSEDNWECGGSNVWVLFIKPYLKDTSNVSNFIVERTTISDGVNLIEEINIKGLFSSGAGIAIYLAPRLVYDVHIIIAKCNFMSNIDNFSAHLYLIILSSCSVLIKESNFTHANKLTEGSPMQLIPVVQPNFGTLALIVRDGGRVATDVEIVMNKVHLAENVGGGLYASLALELPQSNIQLKLKKIDIEHNFIVRQRYKHIYIVRLEEPMTNTGGVYTSLESVQIFNNVLVFQDENPWSTSGGSRGVSKVSMDTPFRQNRTENCTIINT